MDVQQVADWLKRLVNLDLRVFDEIRTNPTATIPGATIAFVSILISGFGGWLWWLLQDYPEQGEILVNSALLGSVLAFVLWGMWLMLVYVMLTQIFRERAYVEQLLRVMGLAASPLALMGLMFIPGLSFAIGLAALGLAVSLTNVAIKSVTTADQSQVLVCNLLGFFVWCAGLTLLSSSVEPHAPGIFLFESISRNFSDVFAAAP